MKNRQFQLREELSDQANIVRMYRWFRTRGHGVRPMGKMERRVRTRFAFIKPGGRRSLFKRKEAGL